MRKHPVNPSAVLSLIRLIVVACFSICVLAQQPGTLDTSFDPGVGIDGVVNVVLALPNGKIFIGGTFTHVGGTNRGCIARLNADGSLDPTFDPGPGLTGQYYLEGAFPRGPNVMAAAVQTDGKIVIAGNFTNIAGLARDGTARLNIDGRPDPTFGGGFGYAMKSVIIQPDGRIVVCGGSGLGGPELRRLLVDGVLDVRGDTRVKNFSDNFIPFFNRAALQDDGKLLVGGSFTVLTSSGTYGAARFNSDLQLDLNYNSAVTPFFGITTLPGGKAWAVGRNQLARLNADGAIDASFPPVPIGGLPTFPNYNTEIILPTADGSIVLLGGFNAVGGVPHTNIARITSFGALDAGFNSNAATDSPIVSAALQSDGKFLIAGGFTAVNGQPRKWIARLHNGSSTPALPVIETQPNDLAIQFGGTTSFTSGVSTVGVTSYQWYFDGVPLEGATNTTLVLTNLHYKQAGRYQLKASNAGGTVSSRVVTLKVLVSGGAADAVLSAQLGFLGNAFTSPYGSKHSEIYSLAIQPDGRLLVGGSITNISGSTRYGIARITSDDKLDVNFASDLGAGFQAVELALMPNGKVLARTGFSLQYQNFDIWRLNRDGTLDTTFAVTTAAGTNLAVYGFAAQKSGKAILACSGFNQAAPKGNPSVLRVNDDGTLDTTFVPTSFGGAPYQYTLITALAMFADDSILVAGNSTVDVPKIIKVMPNGSIDSRFNAADIIANVSVLSALPDGKVVGFHGRVFRLNADGSTDAGFAMSSGNGAVYTMAAQRDGKIWLGGVFGSWNGVARHGMVRLNADGSVDTSIPDLAPTIQIVYAMAYNNGSLYFGGFQNPSVSGSYLGRTYVGPAEVKLFDPFRFDSTFGFYLPTDSNRVYRLEWKGHLGETNWKPSITVTGDGNALKFTEPSAVESSRIYRAVRD